MSQINTGTVAGENKTAGRSKAVTKAAKAKAAAEAQAKAEAEAQAHTEALEARVSEVFTHAGTAWEARLNMGRAIIAAQKQGVTLLEIQSRLWEGTPEQVRAVRAVCGIGKSKDEPNAKATGLSVLARIAEVLGADLVSPDGKYRVTSEQIAVWQLSTDDAVRLSRLLEPRTDKSGTDATKMRVKQLVDHVKDAAKAKETDGGRARVLKHMDSLRTSPRENTGGTSKKLKMPSATYQKLIKAASAKGIKPVELLEQLLGA